MSVSAYCTIAFGFISILCLVILHFISPEFKSNFRMISEYALGNHKWLLTIFFITWGSCSISSALMLWNSVTGNWARTGVFLLLVSGTGAIMGGLFDVRHKLHGLSFGIGVPFLPIGALLVTYHLLKNAEWQPYSPAILLSAHSTWISVLLLGATMFLLFFTLKSSGVAFGPDSPPLASLPAGVIGINGWANRLLVLCYLSYPLLTAKIVLSILETQK